MAGEQSERSEREIREIKELLTGKPYDREDGGLIGDVRELRQLMVGSEDDREAGLVQTVRRVDARTWLILVGVVLGPVAGIVLSALVGK